MLAYFLIAISQIVAWIILYLEGYTMDVGIIVALIGIAGSLIAVAGGIWRQVVQFKKDAQRIDGVNQTALSVERDTSIMRPVVVRIDNTLDNLKDKYISRESRLDSAMKGVSELLESKRVDDTIKQRVSSSIDNPAYIQNAVSLVYEKNAALEAQIFELQNDKLQMQAHIQVLQSENNNLKQENSKLRDKVRNMEGRGAR